MADRKIVNEHALSDSTKKKVEAFEESDKKFKALLSKFMDKYAQEIMEIDNAREERNARLNDAKDALRENAWDADITEVQSIKYGPLKVSKKWSEYYLTDSFVQIAKDAGVYDKLIESGVVKLVTQIDSKLAKHWLDANSLTEKFEQAVDGKELTPAITGAKEVVPFGAEK